ncbi:MAG: antibiotic biosynthesis monooxygenase [Candidatus Rokubacteria bacterium]|nr:antibiotic biosynthesis monooxygenase [Candidatus Rokubacteria bacterium]
MLRAPRTWVAAMLVVAVCGGTAPGAHAADGSLMVIVKFHPTPGREDELKKRLVDLSAFTERANPGVTYRVYRSTTEPTVFLLYETFPARAAWEDQAAKVFPAFQKVHGPVPAGIVTRPPEPERFVPVGD